jgi:hypothetical protein
VGQFDGCPGCPESHQVLRLKFFPRQAALKNQTDAGLALDKAVKNFNTTLTQVTLAPVTPCNLPLA